MKILQFKSELKFKFSDDKDLLKKLQQEYTILGYTPNITIKGNNIIIDIDDRAFEKTQKDFQKAIDLCNVHNFDKAEKVLNNIIEQNPLFADAHRFLAQISMERGEYDKAIDQNIEALRVDHTNLYALVLMGNIYAHKNELDTAEIYYNKVVEYHPDDVYGLNNLAANAIKRKQYDKAIDLMLKVLTIDDTYLNSYYGIALSYYEMHEYEKAFEYGVKGMKKGLQRPQDRGVREEIQKLTMTVANEIVSKTNYEEIEIEQEKLQLSKMTSVPMRVEQDANLNVSARLEYHVSRNRDYNRVVYNTTKKYHEHLLMHEFMHLEMNIEASNVSKNKLTFSGTKERDAFSKWIAPQMSKIKTQLTAERFKAFEEQLYTGLLLQATNSALDLLVEDRIYSKYPKMHPIQMLSLVGMELENVESVKRTANSALPAKVVSANKIMNMVSAMHLHDLYGFDITPHYKGSVMEKKKAEDLYEEYKAYKDDYKPGEEYDLMEYFIDSLGLSEFICIENEIHFKELNIKPKEEYPAECIDPESHEEQNAAFAEMHKDGENETETFMMSMYMLGALQYMKPMPKHDVHRIAIEIAMVGMNGISPEKKGYKIASIPNKEFRGYEFLAYYYVSWAIAVPEKVDQLGLPFSKAYETALQMYNAKNGK